jgi:hypothetical protein
VRVRVRDVVETEQRHDRFVERAHLEQRHLCILLDVMEVFHKAVLRKEVDERVLVALQLHWDPGNVQQRYGTHGFVGAAATIPMQWRARKVARVLQLEAVHVAARHRDARVLGEIHA